MTTTRSKQRTSTVTRRSVRRGLTSAALAACGAILAACASPPVDTPPTASYRRVGVMSVAAAALTQHQPGARPGEEHPAVRDIAAWNVDRAYEDQLAAAVQATLGVAVVKAPTTALAAAFNDPANPYMQPGFWAYRTDPVATGLRDYCAGNQLDAVVVASQSVDEDALGGSYRPLIGAGVYLRGDRPLVHLSAALSLVDCETGRTVERRRVGSGRSFAGSHGYPVRELPVGLVHGTITQMSSDEDARLRQALVALPAQAWVDTLENMVHPAQPPAFGRTMFPNS